MQDDALRKLESLLGTRACGAVQAVKALVGGGAVRASQRRADACRLAAMSLLLWSALHPVLLVCAVCHCFTPLSMHCPLTPFRLSFGFARKLLLKPCYEP